MLVVPHFLAIPNSELEGSADFGTLLTLRLLQRWGTHLSVVILFDHCLAGATFSMLSTEKKRYILPQIDVVRFAEPVHRNYSKLTPKSVSDIFAFVNCSFLSSDARRTGKSETCIMNRSGGAIDENAPVSSILILLILTWEKIRC